MELTKQIENLLEQIADGYPSTQRFSTMPASLKSEGGKAFKSTTGELLSRAIKKEWVPQTIQQVYNLLDRTGFVDIDSAQPLGSTLWLSKPELGDLDILIKPSRPFDLATFKNALIDFFYLEGIPVRDLAEKGRDYLFDEFSFLFPIIDDNNQITSDLVQVDLLLAEDDAAYKWRRVWYASPKDSEWKGAARNVMLGIVASARGMIWAKNGLFQKQTVEGDFEYEESNLLSNEPEEAVGIVFGTPNLSIIESVETMRHVLDIEGVLLPLKDAILNKFNEVVQAYEAEGREMRNHRRIDNGLK